MLARNHVHFDVVAVCDSQSWQLQPGGLSDDQLRDIVARKAQGQAVGEKRPSTLQILNLLAEAGLEQVIVVDVTAVSGLEPTLNRALELGYGVVLANKKCSPALGDGAALLPPPTHPPRVYRRRRPAGHRHPTLPAGHQRPDSRNQGPTQRHARFYLPAA